MAWSFYVEDKLLGYANHTGSFVEGIQLTVIFQAPRLKNLTWCRITAISNSKLVENTIVLWKLIRLNKGVFNLKM